MVFMGARKGFFELKFFLGSNFLQLRRKNAVNYIKWSVDGTMQQLLYWKTWLTVAH
jgi:hypothetical protein